MSNGLPYKSDKRIISVTSQQGLDGYAEVTMTIEGGFPDSDKVVVLPYYVDPGIIGLSSWYVESWESAINQPIKTNLRRDTMVGYHATHHVWHFNEEIWHGWPWVMV